MSEKYHLIFNGNILSGFDENEVKEKVAKILNIPASQREAFFSGREITLKKDLSLDDALKLKSQLEQLGLMITMMSAVMADMYSSVNQVKAEKKAIEKKLADDVDETIEERRRAAREEYELLMAQKAEDEAVEVDKPPALLSLSLEGRYGRLNYLNAGLLAFLLVIGVTFFVSILSGSSKSMGGSFIFTIVGWLYFLVSFRFSILRLHDLNLSGWYLVLGFVPFIGGLFSLYLLFARGNENENDYGYPPREGSKLGLFGIIFVVVALFWLAGYR